MKADCECPIVVSGSLRLERKRIHHLSTETNRWDKALATATQWEDWEALTNPNPTTDENVTFDSAAGKYLDMKGPNGENIERSTLRKYEVLLHHRMKTFCVENNIVFIKAFENPATVTACFLTWKNLNPTKNRKTVSQIVQPLGDQTKRAELERYRAFLRFCVDQGWLKANHALKIKLSTIKPSAKFGLNPDEESRIWDAMELVSNRRQLDQYNSKELRALCLVMRHAGLRVSDAVTLNDAQLVRRESGAGYAIKIMAQQKTKEWVRVPITMEVYEALHGLTFKGERDGKKFWFYTGNGERKTAINNWRERIQNLFNMAQEDKPFDHHASSHTWRHTFAISHLNQGTDLKMVSRWLGHSSIRITEAHYGHANRSTHIASEIAYDESVRLQKASCGALSGK